MIPTTPPPTLTKTLYVQNIMFRVTTCLEMSGNMTAVRVMSEILLKVREKILSGKSCLKLFIVSCIFVSIQVFSTSTGMI